MVKKFGGVGCVTNKKLLVMIWITMQIQKFLKEFLPVWDRVSCTSFFADNLESCEFVWSF